MANQAIALQARAPQTDFLGRAVQQNAQMMNMMSQQRAAERQAAQAQQAMEIARAEEGRKAELHGPAMDKARFESFSAEQKAVMEFMELAYEGVEQSRNPDDVVKIAGFLKQHFPSPVLAQVIDQTLADMPTDPALFPEWQKTTKFETLKNTEQLAEEFTTQNLGGSTRIVATPKYGGGGAARVVEGSEAPVMVKPTGMNVEGVGPGVLDPESNTFFPATMGTPGGYTPPRGPMSEPRGAPGAPAGGDTFSRMINVESRGQQFDRSGKPLTSRAGAIGIAQVMPGTAPEAARLAGLPFDENRYRNDPEYNFALGKAYYEKQLADFGDERLAAAAYNAGPGAVRRALQKGGPNGWINHVPRETQDYVRDVFGAAPAGRGSAGGPDIRFGEAIPGTGKGEKVAAEAYTAMDSAMARYDNTIKLAEDLLNNPALDSIIGNIQGNIPETLLSLSSQDAANALADYNSLIAVAGFSELQTLKAESKTGAALGPVSDRENTFLQQSAFKTSRAQDETKFRQSLRDYIKRVKESKERVETGYERTYGGRFAPTPGGSSQPPAAAPAKSPTRTTGGATVTDW